MSPWAMGLPLSIGPIVDVLQFNQKNLDTGVKAMQIENLELQRQYEELHTETPRDGEIIHRFLGTVPQVMEEAQKQKELEAEI